MTINTNKLSVEIKDSPDVAPNYANNGEGFTVASLTTAIIVRKGTENGNDTVDLQFTDEAGNKFVAMTTGRMIQSLALMVNVHDGSHD